MPWARSLRWMISKRSAASPSNPLLRVSFEDLALSALLLIAFGLTVANQFSGFFLVDIGVSPLVVKLIPRWSFFAPVPPRSDVYLLCRVSQGGRVGDWFTVQSAERQPPASAVWNPYALHNKALVDMENLLIEQSHRLVDEHDRRLVQLSGAYLTALRLAERRVIATESARLDWYQFAFANAGGALQPDDAELRFLSYRHKPAAQ